VEALIAVPIVKRPLESLHMHGRDHMAEQEPLQSDSDLKFAVFHYYFTSINYDDIGQTCYGMLLYRYNLYHC